MTVEANRAGEAQSKRRAFISLADLRSKHGVTIPDVRELERTDPSFPPVQWTGARKGMIVEAEFLEWFETRGDRAAEAREQHRRRRAFVGGSGEEQIPRFLRGGS